MEAAAAAGNSLEVVNATCVAVDGVGGVWRGRERVDEDLPDVVVARVGNWRPDSLLAMLETFTRQGVPTPNPAPAIRTGRDHWRTSVALAAAGLPVPMTMAGADPDTLAAAVTGCMPFPVVVKQRRSRMGVGVIRCDARDHLEAVLDSLWRVGDELLVQSYVETGGRSLRVLVAGSRVVAAAEFTAAAGEWRSNAARGGEARATDLESDEADLALRASRSLGLGICGVDLLPAADETLICEVNPTPGFSALERATGIDVAAAIVGHLAQLAG